MGFSHEWEKLYSENQHNSVWPWSDLVSYVMRYCDHTKHLKVLELGCGAGANIPFFKLINADYYAIEGSVTAVEMLRQKFPCYKSNIVCGDFTQDIIFKDKFDLVVDRASLTHNSSDDIKKCLRLVANALNNCGKFIGIHWFSTQHSDYKVGKGDCIDQHTRINISSEQFQGVGKIHFSDEKHLRDLFKGFLEMKVWEHHTVERFPEKQILAMWNFLACKK